MRGSWGLAILLAGCGPAAAQPGPEALLLELTNPEQAAVRRAVARQLGDALFPEFRNVRPIASEMRNEAEYCGQVRVAEPGGAASDFRLFLYTRSAAGEVARILDSDQLNGYRVGRKMIAALRRAGCL